MPLTPSEPFTEFDVIRHYFTWQSTQASTIKSVGDDCAILSPAANKRLVMSMDTLVAGRHFPDNASPYQIGTRALCTSLSDLAAMGAKPLWFTLGLTLPSVSKEWLQQFSAGLFSVAAPYHCDLVGGDTTQGPLTITIQVHGEADIDQVLTRDQAQAGDRLFVTGSMGDGAAALALLQGEVTINKKGQDYLLERFYTPTPQIAAGQIIAPLANAAIDISDGLLADAQHIAQASQVKMLIHVEQIPLASVLTGFSDERCWSWALSGGDDYQLLFAVGPQHIEAIQSLIKQGMLDASMIGEVLATDTQPYSVQCLHNGQPYQGIGDETGYQHFAS